jgi:hypothetical protein
MKNFRFVDGGGEVVLEVVESAEGLFVGAEGTCGS